ncbi:ABC transporter permease [Zhaonella formicivorans]|uniref:ABC transporter permease n=1 Tax=Zhaonella formicivorans TaxID=2528593 RepID=UPI001D1135A8|nr:ABC transporter permease [Zhaonella formicivorans]
MNWLELWRRPDLSLQAWQVFKRNLLVFKKIWVTNITFNFLEPLMYLGAMGYGLGMYVTDIQGMPYLNFIAPGLIASSAMWAAASECSYDSFVRMKFQHTYHAIIATPINIEEVVLGDILFGVFKSVLYGSVILLVIAVLGLVPSFYALLIPLVLVLCGFVFAELGLIWVGFVPNIDSLSYFFTLLVTPMFLFAGVFYPLEGMPLFIQRLAWFTPLYHLVVLIRSLSFGQVSWNLLFNVLWLVIFILIFLFPPLNLMRQRLIK